MQEMSQENKNIQKENLKGPTGAIKSKYVINSNDITVGIKEDNEGGCILACYLNVCISFETEKVFNTMRIDFIPHYNSLSDLSDLHSNIAYEFDSQLRQFIASISPQNDYEVIFSKFYPEVLFVLSGSPFYEFYYQKIQGSAKDKLKLIQDKLQKASSKSDGIEYKVLEAQAQCLASDIELRNVTKLLIESSI